MCLWLGWIVKATVLLLGIYVIYCYSFNVNLDKVYEARVVLCVYCVFLVFLLFFFDYI